MRADWNEFVTLIEIACYDHFAVTALAVTHRECDRLNHLVVAAPYVQ
jgi:hypothetical protein